MNQVQALLNDLVPKKGKTPAAVAKQLGISSQRLGQYLKGRQLPKPDFYAIWKKTFGEDLIKMSETFVSRETSTESQHEELKLIKENLNKLTLSIGRLAGLSKEETYEVFSPSASDNKPAKVIFREFPKDTPKGKSSKKDKQRKS